MTINYAIAAEVIDISSDSPKPTDTFLVDTNIWYWMTYSNAKADEPHWRVKAMNACNAYVGKADTIGSRLCWCGLSLAELAHLIETSERQLYEKYYGKTEAKKYRHNFGNEHVRIVSEVQDVWRQVKSLATPIDLLVDDQTTEAALARFQAEKVDGYDLFILEAMNRNHVVQIITDDGDFSTVSGIQMFTGNKNVIESARTQGKLLNR